MLLQTIPHCNLTTDRVEAEILSCFDNWLKSFEWIGPGVVAVIMGETPCNSLWEKSEVVSGKQKLDKATSKHTALYIFSQTHGNRARMYGGSVGDFLRFSGGYSWPWLNLDKLLSCKHHETPFTWSDDNTDHYAHSDIPSRLVDRPLQPMMSRESKPFLSREVTTSLPLPSKQLHVCTTYTVYYLIFGIRCHHHHHVVSML